MSREKWLNLVKLKKKQTVMTHNTTGDPKGGYALMYVDMVYHNQIIHSTWRTA